MTRTPMHSLRRLTSSARVPALIAAGLLCVQAWMPALVARADVSAVRDLTCFAVDVSGSNIAAYDGEPPSDPGPIFVRQQVAELYTEVLADLSQAMDQQVGVVTFGTGIGAEIGPLAISEPATQSQLETALPHALQPSSAEAAWTNWVAGVTGCEQMFERSGATHGMVVVLTDGYPEGPAGGPARQLAAIAPTARGLWADGIAIRPVLYGAGANQPGPARQAMTQLAAIGHGRLMLAATPLDMLRSALFLASLSAGLPLGGSDVPVNGSSSVPLDVSAQVAAAVLVVLRSSSQVQVTVADPGGKKLASAAAGTGTLGLVIAVPRPAAGAYEASADGQGSMFAAELLRSDAVRLASPGPSASPHRTQPGAASRLAQPSAASGFGVAWVLALGVGVLAVALASGWLIRSRRCPRGTLVVWWGSLCISLAPADLDGLVKLEDLFQAGGARTGWSVGWTHQSPTVFDPDDVAVRLTADETRTVPTTPPATFTWFPDGADTSLSDEPPGRPASTVPWHLDRHD
jgi:hypothetical protein